MIEFTEANLLSLLEEMCKPKTREDLEAEIITTQEWLQGQCPFFANVYHTGSTAICEPPPTDTDIDFVCLVEPGFGLDDATDCLEGSGYKQTSLTAEDYEGATNEDGSVRFRTFRKDVINLIVTEQMEFYLSYVQATKEASRLNLLNKEDRIALFKQYQNKNEISV